MEEKLAAVERNVNRKRVAKNPFQLMFTSLTESPFASTSVHSQHGEGQEMETISRQILVRMEVIAKQIAFLSKETSGQPSKILTAVGAKGGSGQSQQGTLGDNTSLSSGPKANPDRTTTIPPQPSSETNLSSDPLSGMSLSARVSLFMQIRQGQAKAKDLLPDSVLSLSLRSLALAKETQRSSHHEDYGAHNAPISGDRHGRSNNREFGRRSKGCRATAAAAEYAPSGILHQFIKHVKPFSLHLDDAARECNTTAVLESPGSGAMSVDHFEGGGDDPVVISENHRHSQATETPRRHDTGDDSRQSTEDLIFGARRLVGSVGKGQQKSAGGQSGAVDVPRKPKVPTEVGEDMCRANTSLQGKRKLAYSFPASPDGGARLWSVDLAGRAAARNARKPVEMATSAGPSSQGLRKRKNAQGEMGGEAKGTKRSGASDEAVALDLTSLSWKSAKSFRRQMENALAVHLHSSLKKKGRKRTGGRTPAHKITVADPVPSGSAAARTMALGTLDLVHVNPHLNIPEIRGKNGGEGYLTSLSSSLRDLAAMKRLFQQQGPEHVSSTTSMSLESPPASPTKTDGEDYQYESSEDFNIDAPGPFRNAHRSDKKAEGEGVGRSLPEEGKCGEPMMENATRFVDSKPGPSIKTGTGTCMIDLKKIWQRTEAISHTISQAVRLSEERNTLLNSLRESFRCLDLQHQQRDHVDMESSDDPDDSPKEKFAALEKHPSGNVALSISLDNAAKAKDVEEGAGEGGTAARTFVLLVSLAHVHNNSPSSAGMVETNDRPGIGSASSQYHVELADGGRRAIVTCTSFLRG